MGSTLRIAAAQTQPKPASDKPADPKAKVKKLL